MTTHHTGADAVENGQSPTDFSGRWYFGFSAAVAYKLVRLVIVRMLQPSNSLECGRSQPSKNGRNAVTHHLDTSHPIMYHIRTV